MHLSVKRDKLFITDNLFFYYLFKLVFLNVITHSQFFKYRKKINVESIFFLYIGEVKFQNLLKKINLENVHQIKVYSIATINLNGLRQKIHELGFNEIETRNFPNLFFLSNYLPSSKNNFIMNGSKPGLPLFASHINPINLYRYSSDKVKFYSWLSSGEYQSHSNYDQLTSLGSSMKIYRSLEIFNKNTQIIEIGFKIFIGMQSSFRLKINFDIREPYDYEEIVFNYLSNVSSYYYSYVKKNIPNIKHIGKGLRFFNGNNKVKVFFNKKDLNIAIYLSTKKISFFSYEFFYGYEERLIIPVKKFRSFNFIFESDKNYHNNINQILPKLI